eukprot:UN08178
MLLDADKLLKDMASNDEYILPLKAFTNHILFGNAMYDSLVSCESALLLYGSDECQYGEQYWKEIENNKDKCCCKELVVNAADNPLYNNAFGVCWFLVLRNDIKWRKIIVAWHHNKWSRCSSHRLLAAPPRCYSGTKIFFQFFHQNFMY